MIEDAISPADTFDSIELSVCVIRDPSAFSAFVARVTSDVIEPSATVILDIAVSAVVFALPAVSCALSAAACAALISLSRILSQDTLKLPFFVPEHFQSKFILFP